MQVSDRLLLCKKEAAAPVVEAEVAAPKLRQEQGCPRGTVGDSAALLRLRVCTRS